MPILIPVQQNSIPLHSDREGVNVLLGGARFPGYVSRAIGQEYSECILPAEFAGSVDEMSVEEQVAQQIATPGSVAAEHPCKDRQVGMP